MTRADWIVVALYAAFLVAVGLWQKRKASRSVDDYFVSGRRLRWWVAGTSMIAASFATDTPLLVSKYVREQGIWGNWQWWGLGISAILTVFLFAPLWRRSGVVTEAELTEMRYSGPAAAGLRGFKAFYWGLLYNAFQAGAWGITGLVVVSEVVLPVDRTTAILVCAAIAGTYAVVSGLWGVVATDSIQFIFAIVGAGALAFYSVDAAGGLGAIAALPSPATTVLPTSGEPLTYCLAFLLVQWWAWKNTDGGGAMVQRMAACRDEREATYATLWFCIVHYAVRAWPWILVGLASLIVLPGADHQRSYAEMIARVLPAGLRGLVVGWFVAEFAASLAGAMNWGGSLLVNDFYRRFVRQGATERHYVLVGRLVTILVLAGAVGTAMVSKDITKAFNYVLQGTAATGVVLAARWLWWRVNAWSEITAMIASPLVTFAILPRLGWNLNTMESLLVILGFSLAPVAVVTLLTRSEDPMALEAFYRRVRPPGPGWGPIAARCPDVRPSLSLRGVAGLWLLGVGAIYGLMYGIGSVLLQRPLGWAALVGGFVLLMILIGILRQRREMA